MVNKTFLIADSGGTSTDWCYIDPSGKKNYFRTESYHPHNFNAEFFTRSSVLFSEMGIKKGTDIYFYGTACSLPMNQKKIRDYFATLEMNVIEVNSDLHGACAGILNKEKGYLAILGTGSILAEYNGEEITETFGGFGFMIGDEGSGFAFGRNLLNKYLNNDFSDEVQKYLYEKLGTRNDVLENVYGAGGKTWIGNLPQQLELFPEIYALHKENLQSFFDLTLNFTHPVSRKVAVVGSYGIFFKEDVEKIIAEKGYLLSKTVQSPIELIVNAIEEKIMQI